MIPFKEGWYVLYVKSRCEKKTEQQIAESGIRTYLPLIKRTKKWSDRNKVVYEPLIKSYLFVYIDNNADMFRVVSFDGACFFLKFGNDYAMAKESEIEQIKLLLATEDVTELEIEERAPIIGQICKIMNGPLIGMKCEVINVDSVRKVRVRIDSLRQDIVATLPHSYLSQVL